jgi:hypothetical protein
VIDRQALLRLVSLIDRLTVERGEARCPMSMSSPPEPDLAHAAGAGPDRGGAAAGRVDEPGRVERRGDQR